MKKINLSDFMLSIVADLEEKGRYGTAHVYHCALKAALSFGGENLCLGDLTSTWLFRYKECLLGRQLSVNTLSTYMGALRTMYNRGVDQHLVLFIPHQFKGIFTNHEASHVRSLGKDDMCSLLTKPLNLPIEATAVPSKEKTPFRHTLLWARACLELMLRLQGIPFVDLAYLRKSDLHDGRITTRRRKTGRRLSVKITPQTMDLIRQMLHPDPDSPYLLDILDGKLTGKKAYLNYLCMLRMLNYRLVQLGILCGLTCKVSSYISRHTWATLAKYCGVPVAVISEALGHANITTTEIYLKQFDDSTMEKANKVTIQYILGK